MVCVFEHCTVLAFLVSIECGWVNGLLVSVPSGGRKAICKSDLSLFKDRPGLELGVASAGLPHTPMSLAPSPVHALPFPHSSCPLMVHPDTSARCGTECVMLLVLTSCCCRGSPHTSMCPLRPLLRTGSEGFHTNCHFIKCLAFQVPPRSRRNQG